MIAPGFYPDGISATPRWWDGQKWTDTYLQHPVTQVQPTAQRRVYKTSHGFHLIMTILTGGLWAIFVWLPIGILNAVRN